MDGEQAEVEPRLRPLQVSEPPFAPTRHIPLTLTSPPVRPPSLALSIKMNFLLYLPALLYLLWTSLGPLPSLPALSLLLLPQLALATPFLHSPASALTYLRTAFNLDRAFLWEWTVNWRWLGEEAFHQKELAGALMVGHVVGLGLVGLSWGEAEGGLLSVIWRGVRSPARAAGRGRPSADREWRGRCKGPAEQSSEADTDGLWSSDRDLHDPLHVQRGRDRLRSLTALPILRLVRAPSRVPPLAGSLRAPPPVSLQATPSAQHPGPANF